jgi:hypothetical protein
VAQAGLVAGVLAVVAALVPLVGIYAAVPLGLMAAVLGGVARRQRVAHGRAPGVATAALALGVVSLCLALSLRLLLGRAMHNP